MIGLLSDEEIDAMLWRNRIGRLACASNDRPYIVPINYAYDGSAIYAYSSIGRKIGMMREQPLVSFEIDEVDTGSSWRSVIVEGRYEELTDGDDRKRALALIARNGDSPVTRTLSDANGARQIVLFRIVVGDRSGRFERRDA